MAPRAWGTLAVILAATSWGTWPLFLRNAEKAASLHPSVEGAVLMAVIAATTLPMALHAARERRARHAPPRTRADWSAMAWLGIGDAGNTILFFAAYQKTTVAVAVLTHYLTPVFVALAAPLLLRERAAKSTFASVVLSFVGLALLLEPWVGPARPGDRIGALCGAGSAVFYASNVLVQKRFGAVFTAGEMMFYHALVACPLLLSTVPAGGFAGLHGEGLAWLLAGSLLPGAFGGVVFVLGLTRIPASHASTLTLLEPLVAVISAMIFFGERRGPTSFFGGFLILVGAALVVSRGRETPSSV